MDGGAQRAARAAEVLDLIAAGRAALRAGDTAAARQAFQAVPATPEVPEAVEGLARVAYLELDMQRAIELWERAYALYRTAADQLGAVRVARTIAAMYGTVVGDRAVMSGWIARAQTLLGDLGDCAERGWVALNLGMFEDDRACKEDRLREAVEVGRRFADTDLEVVALAYLGASMVHGDRTEEGMVHLDEALAAVAGGEVDDFLVVEEVFCQLFSACERAHDVGRADQWIRVGEAIAQRRRLPAVAAFCRTHYGGLLTAAGRWPEADAALTQAVGLWDLGRRSALRIGALVRLADLRARQGRIEEAAALLEGVDVDTEVDAAPPLAAVHLAQGKLDVAHEVLERGLAQVGPASTAAAPLLSLLVDVHLAAGRTGDADATAEQLTRLAQRHPAPYVTAVAALARARHSLASGTGDPRPLLREAVAGFHRAGTPLELGRARLELATVLAATQPEVAKAEARAALASFDALQATVHAAAAASLLRSLGVPLARGGHAAGRADGPLTPREAEVLELVGHGLSNPEIAARLYISRKTVEHHVGRILAKLGVPSRAAAAAYAVTHRPPQEPARK